MIFPLKDGTEWALTPELYNLFDEHYPLIDIDVELKKMQTWLTFNDSRRKTARGMKKAINHWLSNDSIPKAVRKPKIDNTAQYEAQCGAWLRSVQIDDLESNYGFLKRLEVPEFRVWAESVNGLVKGI